jgi:hypothetical protein
MLIVTHLFGALLAIAGLWAIRFELKRDAVPKWRFFLPAALILLCSLALLGGLSSRGRGIWLIALIVGVPSGSVRAVWLLMRADQAARLVRLSPVRDGVVAAFAAVAFAMIDAGVVFRVAEGAAPSPLFAAAVALCAGYLSGRAIVIRSRSESAQHRDLRSRRTGSRRDGA